MHLEVSYLQQVLMLLTSLTDIEDLKKSLITTADKEYIKKTIST